MRGVMADRDPRSPGGPGNPGEPIPLSESPAISEAAERARERLHEEIERVRVGVEEMMAEQGGGDDAALRRELESIREETRVYVKRRVRKSEKRLEKSIDRIERRTQKLERRLDAAEQDRRYAEWRIHTNTEAMLDGLLREVRAIADLFARTR
jgi:chromosome segregation ATPase